MYDTEFLIALGQGYTAGRNYMCLAVTICAWP
jgi:hypothetical protein